MRKFMIAGGLAGFSIALTFGYAQQGAWPIVIWRASVAACCAGLLFRWWAGVWIQSVQDAREQCLTSEPKLPPAPTLLPSKP